MVAVEVLLGATAQHIVLAYAALVISIAIAVPLAVLSLSSRPVASVVMTAANLVQAIPSLAVVAFVVPLLGIGFYPAIIVLVFRAFLPIVKNTWIGLSTTDPTSVEAARGIGLTNGQITRYIRFPHAYPAMFAGIRFAAILTNSVAVLTAIIGSGGLGTLIFEGISGSNIATLLSGAVPAILIAVCVDRALGEVEARIQK
ncbi:ABC transporter permease [Methanofollis fontis]|uniref:ABC transporter permease n=1 Tax=Methanofollis fontis TaxID=2052832 RepID=A0A483CMB1_9EURY|nr:ABC transporter permease [Methanofollis fontis]TAJ44027.1 ABC transporter permease [Methanofollis fontis]